MDLHLDPKPASRQVTPPSDKQNGFTLVEVMVVMVILAVALVGIAWTISYSLRAGSVADRQWTAVTLAETKMNEIINTQDTSEQSDSGSFDPDYPGYTWQTDISGPDDSGLYRIAVTIAYPDRGESQTEQLIAYDPLNNPTPAAETATGGSANASIAP